jgi:hypothetical protein
MKSSISGFRSTVSDLSGSVQQQLNKYAIAAGAAGVSVLALAQPVEAKIVYTPASVQLSGNQHYDLDLNNDGVTDFTLSHFSTHRNYHKGGYDAQAMEEQPATGNGVIGKPPAALVARAIVGHGKLFYGISGIMAFSGGYCGLNHCTHHHGGNWLGVKNRYLGLEFQIKGRTHYGWARLTFEDGVLSATLTGYAYETIAGKSIRAGLTKGTADESGEVDFGPGAFMTAPAPVAPQAASLGMLALGAQGVTLWRRKESEGAASENN